MSEGMPSAERQYREHKNTSEKLAEATAELLRVRELIKDQGFLSKAFGGKIEGSFLHTNAEKKVKRLQDTYEENLRVSGEYADEYLAEARETMEQWKPYADEQVRLSEEIGAEPVILETDGYINTYDEVKSRIPKGLEGKGGRIAGIRDFFKPKLSEPLQVGNLESHGWERLPRMDMGVDAPTAVARATKRGFTQVLRIKQDTRMTSGSWHDIHRKYPVVSTDKKYIPISDETAINLCNSGDMNESISMYRGTMKDWPTMVGILEFDFEVLTLEDLENEQSSQKLVLTYEQVNWQTNKIVPVEIEISGDDGDDLYQKTLKHLADLEMGTESVIAKNAKIK
ncbi:MAG: hypothetical protein V1916_01665, partial [Patescibacteria group bacterium]